MSLTNFPIALTALCCSPAWSADDAQALRNPAIDVDAYLRVASDAMVHRSSRRLTEAQFVRLSGEPATVVLDARSQEKFDELHVKGAVNLSFPDIAIGSLERLLPDKTTRILIYCNNNFRHAESAFPLKRSSASLNLSTYVALYDYGYRNVYELGPLIDIDSTVIEFESTGASVTAATTPDRASPSAALSRP